MRQFKYEYKSFMVNKHGFFSFIPHAKMFHPYYGLRYIGAYYGTEALYYNFIIDEIKKRWQIPFTHKIKMFFPEIKNGVLYVDKIKYSVHSDPLDDIKLLYSVVNNSNYLDYVEIKDHIAEFEIQLKIDKEYMGLNYPVEITCDYIDILLFEQRISITITDNTFKLVPYLGAYRTNFPLFYLPKQELVTTEMTNEFLKYTFVLTPESNDFVKKFNMFTSEVKPMYTAFDKTEQQDSVFLTNISADAANYAMDVSQIHIESDNEDFYPIISNESYLSAVQHCKKGYKSYWYTTVYDKNWLIIDLPGDMPCDSEIDYTADETRGYVQYKLFTTYKKDENILLSELKKIMFKEAYELCSSLNEEYKKHPLPDIFK